MMISFEAQVRNIWLLAKAIAKEYNEPLNVYEFAIGLLRRKWLKSLFAEEKGRFSEEEFLMEVVRIVEECEAQERNILGPGL